MSAVTKERASKLLTAMGNPVRFEIAFLVGLQGPLNVGQIADHFKISRPAISNHLRILREGNILTAEKIGQEVYYSLDHTSIDETLTLILEMVRNSPNHPRP